MKLPIEELTAEAFAPFGRVVEKPNRATDAQGPGFFWYGEIADLTPGDRPYAAGHLELEPAPLRFDWAERHMHTDELLAPVSGTCLIYVGPPEFPDEPGRLPALDHFRVFRVRQGQVVILKPGVWHGAPMAVDGPMTVLVILQRNTAKQDLHLGRFESTPVDVG